MMRIMTEKFVQTLLVGCCMTAAVSCSNAPTAPRVAEYEVLTIAPTDAQTQSNYSATILSLIHISEPTRPY